MPNPFCSASGGMMYGGHWFGIWFQVLVVLLFFAIAWWMIKGGQQPQYRVSPGESAEDILKKRYAKGEITKKQFDEMKKEIGA